MLITQVEDAEANRQGLTIYELGEAGGPGESAHSATLF